MRLIQVQVHVVLVKNYLVANLVVASETELAR